MARSIDSSFLTSDLVTQCGERFHVRVLGAADAGLIERFVNDLSPEDRRFRFLAPLKQLDKKVAAQLARVDADRGIAILATNIATHAPLAIARFHIDDTGSSAEFAVAVQSSVHGRGFGYAIMQHLIKLARLYGLRELWGTILNDNQCMLALAKALGMQLHTSHDDNTVRAALQLPTALSAIPSEC